MPLVTSYILLMFRGKMLEDTNVLLIMDMALPLVSPSYKSTVSYIK